MFIVVTRNLHSPTLLSENSLAIENISHAVGQIIHIIYYYTKNTDNPGIVISIII